MLAIRQAEAGNFWIKYMSSMLFRLLVLFCGVALMIFYGMLMVGAAVNLPVSWFGFLYCLFGTISGILCFIYFFKETKVLFVFIVPAVILMIITLINMTMPR